MSFKPDLSKAKGYNPQFLGDTKIELPVVSPQLKEQLIPLKKKPSEFELKYANYSLMMHQDRRFAVYTASNIDGNLFKQVTRKEVWPGSDKWYKDSRISNKNQWGYALYKAEKSDFDRGHLVKREDVQWGDSREKAIIGARNTFFYTNAAPQHAKLNQGIWQELEDYILHAETRENSLRVNVFTGPVLNEDDPYFVTEVEKSQIQIPTLFWKIVYYIDRNDVLKRVAFLIGQQKLLLKDKIVVKPGRKDFGIEVEADPLFTDFEDAETYQVNIKTIQDLTSLKFASAEEPFDDKRTTKQILRKVQAKNANIMEEGEDMYEVFGIQL